MVGQLHIFLEKEATFPLSASRRDISMAYTEAAGWRLEKQMIHHSKNRGKP
jgi:hypothetical protein